MLRFIPVILGLCVTIVVLLIFAIYIIPSNINENTDKSFATRAKEHVRQENLSIKYHDSILDEGVTIILNQKVLDQKMNNITAELQALKINNVTR